MKPGDAIEEAGGEERTSQLPAALQQHPGEAALGERLRHGPRV